MSGDSFSDPQGKLVLFFYGASALLGLALILC